MGFLEYDLPHKCLRPVVPQQTVLQTIDIGKIVSKSSAIFA